MFIIALQVFTQTALPLPLFCARRSLIRHWVRSSYRVDGLGYQLDHRLCQRLLGSLSISDPTESLQAMDDKRCWHNAGWQKNDHQQT
jgi:hypothetical protein